MPAAIWRGCQTACRKSLKLRVKATSENPCVGGSTPPLGTKFFKDLRGVDTALFPNVSHSVSHFFRKHIRRPNSADIRGRATDAFSVVSHKVFQWVTRTVCDRFSAPCCYSVRGP